MYPDITANSARQQNAKKEKAMPAAAESVNILVVTSLLLSVGGIAEDVDDIKRYATTWNQTICQSTLAKIC